MNTASALIILGFTYIGLTHGWLWWVYLGIVWGFGTWLVYSSEGREKQKALIEAQTNFLKYDLPPVLRAISIIYTEKRS